MIHDPEGKYVDTLRTWEEVKADHDQHREVLIPPMKGRRYKARLRADARWRRDPVVRCKCGHPDGSDDTPRACPFGYCNQYYCPSCGRQSWAWGPVGCPCDCGRTGHGRYSEQPKPHMKVKR